MSGLVKATLREIKSDEEGRPLGEPIPVQFNPASLKLQLSNVVEGGAARGRQTRQYLGSSSTELTFELVFDTADETSGGGKPRSVREKTAQVEKFVLPKGKGRDKEAPPKVRFHWGDIVVDGVISSISIDMDLFSADGIPLRAKMSVTIKEQNAKYEFLKAGAGANKAGDAPLAGKPGAATPGSGGGGATDRTATAIAGESAAEFAARAGLDPAAWRGLAGQLEGTLSLQAGLELDFNASLSASAGLGVSVGVEAGAAVSLEGAFGLEASATVAAAAPLGATADAAAGFALAAAGGVSAAIETVQTVKTESAAAAARQAFGAPPALAPAPAASSSSTLPSRGVGSLPGATAAAATPGVTTPPRPTPPEQRRTPLAYDDRTRLAPAPAPPLADPRATSFGFGVPLRPRVGGAAELRAGVVAGRIPLRPGRAVHEAPLIRDPTAPPWMQLPAADRSRAAATHGGGRSSCAGGCGHPCRCQGGHA